MPIGKDIILILTVSILIWKRDLPYWTPFWQPSWRYLSASLIHLMRHRVCNISMTVTTGHRNILTGRPKQKTAWTVNKASALTGHWITLSHGIILLLRSIIPFWLWCRKPKSVSRGRIVFKHAISCPLKHWAFTVQPMGTRIWVNSVLPIIVRRLAAIWHACSIRMMISIWVHSLSVVTDIPLLVRPIRMPISFPEH